MANTIKIKRSAVQGRIPAVGDLSLGELALNTYDGKLYTLKNDGTASVVEIGASSSTFSTNISLQNQFATRYYEETANGTNFVAIRAPSALTADVTLTLPTTDGDADQVLATDGSGNLSWVSRVSGGGTSGDFLVSSTASEQAGYFGNIYLKDDSNTSHYLEVTNSADLTALRTLSINVNDASRSVTLAGNLSLANSLTTSGNFALTLTTTAATNVTLPTTGTLAVNNQTMNIGTTAVAINRASANLALTGITSIDGSAATLTTTRTLWGQNFNGSANVSGNLTAVGSITGTGAVTLTATSGTLSLVATGANLASITTNGAERVRVDSAGNVGIGSTSPNATLVVNGSARFFTSSQGDVTITHSAYVSTIRGASAVQLVLGANNTDVIRINNSSQVGIGTTNPVSTFQIKDTLAFETTTTTTSSTSQVAVDTFAAATFRSAKYQVQVTCPGQVATLGSITNGGTGYTAGTFNVTFSNSSGTGAGAQGTVVISNGTVGAVGVGTTGGTGYTAGDVLTASGGSGFQVAVGTVNGSGTILTFGAITSAGAGYTAGVGIGTTTLTLLGGTGTGATATATINDGVITSAALLQQPTTGTGGTVFYAGSNYTTSTVLTIAKTDVTNTIITIADSGGVSVFTSLTAHGVGVNDIVRVSSTANGLTAGTDYYVVTAPTTTTFTLGTTSGVGTTFTNGTSLSVGFYRNSAIAGGTVAYLNAISAISTSYQVSDLMVLHDGATADYIEYATIATRDVLGTFAADISSSNARLLFTPTYTTNTVKVARQAVTV